MIICCFGRCLWEIWYNSLRNKSSYFPFHHAVNVYCLNRIKLKLFIIVQCITVEVHTRFIYWNCVKHIINGCTCAVLFSIIMESFMWRLSSFLLGVICILRIFRCIYLIFFLYTIVFKNCIVGRKVGFLFLFYDSTYSKVTMLCRHS